MGQQARLGPVGRRASFMQACVCVRVHACQNFGGMGVRCAGAFAKAYLQQGSWAGGKRQCPGAQAGPGQGR